MMVPLMSWSVFVHKWLLQVGTIWVFPSGNIVHIGLFFFLSFIVAQNVCLCNGQDTLIQMLPSTFFSS